MKSAILTVLISTTALVGTSIAQAQVSIRDLQRNPGISISGEIRSVVGNEFILDDGTGQIIVDAGSQRVKLEAPYFSTERKAPLATSVSLCYNNTADTRNGYLRHW